MRPSVTSSALTKPIGMGPTRNNSAAQRDDHHMLSSGLQELQAGGRSCLEYPFDALRRPTLMKRHSQSTICDWPDCPNVAEHVFGMIVELRQFVAVCSEHARQASHRKRINPAADTLVTAGDIL